MGLQRRTTKNGQRRLFRPYWVKPHDELCQMLGLKWLSFIFLNCVTSQGMLLCMVGIYMFCNSKVFQGRRFLGLQYRDLGYGPSLTWQSWLVPTSSSWTSSMMMGRQRRETSRWGPLLSRGPSVRWRPLAKSLLIFGPLGLEDSSSQHHYLSTPSSCFHLAVSLA